MCVPNPNWELVPQLKALPSVICLETLGALRCSIMIIWDYGALKMEQGQIIQDFVCEDV